MQIWKYKLPLTPITSISMPKGACFLDVQLQYGDIKLWFLVDPEVIQEERHFAILGTGHDFSDRGYQYRGTVQQHGGQFVWHVFEVM